MKNITKMEEQLKMEIAVEFSKGLKSALPKETMIKIIELTRNRDILEFGYSHDLCASRIYTHKVLKNIVKLNEFRNHRGYCYTNDFCKSGEYAGNAIFHVWRSHFDKGNNLMCAILDKFEPEIIGAARDIARDNDFFINTK